jgi:hypothetical protein
MARGKSAASAPVAVIAIRLNVERSTRRIPNSHCSFQLIPQTPCASGSFLGGETAIYWFAAWPKSEQRRGTLLKELWPIFAAVKSDNSR